MSDKTKIVVKVGKTSNLRLRGLKALRALNFSDVDRLTSKFDTASLIIESILPYEMDSALELVKDLQDKGKYVFLYCKDGANTQEQEVSEQLGIDIATNLDELQHAISKQLAYRVSTAWCRTVQISEDTIDGFEEQSNEPIEIQEAPRQAKYDLQEAIYSLNNSKSTEEVHKAITNKDDILESLGIFSYSELDLDVDKKAEISQKDLLGETKEFEEDSLAGAKKQALADLYSLLDEVTKEKQALSEQLGQAFSKIESLLDIKEAIEDERDLYKKMLEGIDERSDIIEDPVPGVQLDEARSKISELRQKNMGLEQRVIEYLAESKAFDERINKLNEQISELNDSLAELESQIEEKDRQIRGLEENLTRSESMKLEMTTLRSDKASLEKQVSLLKNKVSDLTRQVDSAVGKSSVGDLEKITQLRTDIEQLNSVISAYNEDAIIESKGRIIINTLLSGAIKQNSLSSAELAKKSAEVAELNTLVKRLKSSVSSTEVEYNHIKSRYDELLGDMDNYREKFDVEKEEMQAQFNADLGKLRAELDTKQFEYRKLREELARVSKQLNSKEIELSRVLESSGVEKKSADEAITAKRTLEEANETLNKTVKVLKQELVKMTAKLSMTEDANYKLEQSNKKLKTELASIGTGNNQSSQMQNSSKQAPVIFRVKLDCEYNGMAKIIPIFGSGSFGITTMAMSIARKIPKASILYMDLDLTNPKADGWFKKTPFAKLEDIKDPFSRSSFGALLEKGPNYVMDHPELFQRVADNKLGYSLDYFSGVYQRVDPRKLMMIDFSGFITHLGNKYQYIIVDLGRLGSSDPSDELIRMFCNIAEHNILVTLNDVIDTRSARIKLLSNKIDAKKTVWVLNMSENSNVAPQVQKSIGEATPIIMPKEVEMYGKMVTFDRVPLIKDKLGQIMDLLLQ